MAQYLSVGWFKAIGIVPALFVMGLVLCKLDIIYWLGATTIFIAITIGVIYGAFFVLKIFCVLFSKFTIWLKLIFIKLYFNFSINSIYSVFIGDRPNIASFLIKEYFSICF